jgi:PAS domain S-box-containing protein
VSASPGHSLRRKLFQLTLAAVLTALLVTVVSMVIYELTTFRPRALANAKSQAELLAEIIVPALEFDDARTAEKLLSVLRHEEMVRLAGIYRVDGSRLADYHRANDQSLLPQTSPAGMDEVVGRDLNVAVNVVSEGQTIGRVWLQATMPGWWERYRQYSPLLLLVAVAVVVLSLSIALATRRQITDPVQALAETVRRIGESQDLAVRVPAGDLGEVGELARSFNDMLGAIGQRDRLLQQREARLVRHNAGLAQLNRTELKDESDYTHALQSITALAADIQEVERVGIWMLDDNREAIHCADEFLRGPRSHGAGGELRRADYPTFFRTLDLGQVQEISNARLDPRTRDFAGAYLEQSGVGAMLDVPIHWRGQVVGVLCHEHVGGPRDWYADETALAAAFAERIAHLLERRSTMRADEALRDSEERYRNFISQAQDAIFTLSMDGRIQSVNDAVRRFTGWDLNTWLGHRFQRVLLPEDVAKAEERFAAVLAGESPPSFELGIRSRTGGVVTLEFAISPQLKEGRVIGLLGIGRDVTERKQAAEARARLEEQLRHSQKMEAIGTMAGGIAHDFNNILTAIIGNAQLAEMDLAQNHPARDYLVQTLIASHRAKELVSQILAFSRRQEKKLTPISLVEVVRESLKLLRPVIASTIRIETRLPSGLPPIMGDGTQLQQVVVNLATNAAHAMEEHGGRLELIMDEVEVDLEMAAQKPQLNPGRFIRLVITDSGVGMSAAVLDKIFDPFFTTKGKGKGTGLGLAVVHGIVQQHGGTITVHSEEGQGTTFQIFFPVTVPAAKGVPDVPLNLPTVHPLGAGEAILVVDDEAQVLGVASAVLSRNGYNPVVYQDPLLALADLRQRPNHWDLVITDQLMPSMKGTKLAAEIWKLRPDLPIILATGFAGNLDETAIHHVGFAGLLQKPFTRDSVLSLTSHVLQRKV